MAPKSRSVSMEKDDLKWEKSDEVVELWEKSLHDANLYRSIGHLILKYRPGKAVELHRPIRGGFNVSFRLEYDDGSSAAMRIPQKGVVKFPEEKIQYEVATMRYVAANTTIPVPKIYHWGTGGENPTGLGPFIIMEYIEHDRTMSDALNDPRRGPDESHMLDANISDEKLKFLYRQMADFILQLSTLSFPRIGSLVENNDGSVSVSGRPLIQNMNSLVDFTGVVPSLLPTQPYSTSTEWYSAMADMHLSQLTFQQNDAVLDEDDARDKYVARQLFRRLAAKKQLTYGFDSDNPNSKAYCETLFQLYSEDLRPSNVLIDKDLRVMGVIDWEFAYAAPAQFSIDPPWWLLLKCPEEWPGGYDSWMETYEPRLNTFLEVMEEEESKLQTLSALARDTGMSLSQHMRKSWEKKTWMISFASRNSWTFDYIFWRYLDCAYFGQNESADYQGRLGMLSKKELEAMETMVKLKMEQRRNRIINQWDHDDALAQLDKVMVEERSQDIDRGKPV